MEGENPYLKGDGPPPATRPFKIKFVDEQQREHVVEVDPARIPYDEHGLPGSLLEIALGNSIKIDHACGGVCACATCHVIVRAGAEACHAASEDEEDQLDSAYGLTADSRLACQCVPTGAADLVVKVPTWNRNLARESE
ncbi:MAG: 2Fe-2S iron-sulfur cluster-binding protein [Planctomycetota bacterium]